MKNNVIWRSMVICMLLISILLFVGASHVEKESSATFYENTSIDIEITKPLKGHLYYYGRDVLPIGFATVVIGPITVEARIESEKAVERVEFYVDDGIRHTDYREPYSWKNAEAFHLRHLLKVVAYDEEENKAEYEMPLWIFSGGIETTPPEVWITSPSPSGRCHESSWEIAPVSEEVIMISASQINGSEEISYTLFEYSSDETEWIPIGIDDYGGFEGYILEDSDNPPWYGGNKKIGDEGWCMKWNVSGMEEGTYFIRVTMEDETGSRGMCIRKICIDRSPPLPAIESPHFGDKVNGIIEFRASSMAKDVVKMEVKLFHGSPGWYNQTGFGNARQNPGDGKICVPTAVANALAGLDDEKVYPPGQEGNDSAVQKALMDEMKTNLSTGTNCWTSLYGPFLDGPGRYSTDSMGDALKSYLEKRGIGCSNKSGYEVTVYRLTISKQDGGFGVVPGSNEITFEEYSKQIRLNQRVILAWADWEMREKLSASNDYRIMFPKNGSSHAVNGRGTSSEPYRGHNQASIMDTNGQNKTISWTNQSDYGGGNVSMIKVDGEWKILIGMWVICPKSNDAQSSSIGIDVTPEDGFTIAYDTTQLEDGVHTFIVEMTDSSGFVGTDSIVLEIDNIPQDNEPPVVEITNPENNTETFTPHINITGYASDTGSGIVLMEYIWEWEGGMANDSKNYEPPRSEIPFRIEIFELMEGWNRITVRVKDAAGNYGEDSVTIFYLPDGQDVTPPITTKEVGKPSWEDGYTVTNSTPIWLNATDDLSGVDYIYYEVWWDANENGVIDEDEMVVNDVVYDDTATIKFGEWDLLNLVMLCWFAVDNAGNAEVIHCQEHYVLM